MLTIYFNGVGTTARLSEVIGASESVVRRRVWRSRKSLSKAHRQTNVYLQDKRFKVKGGSKKVVTVTINSLSPSRRQWRREGDRETVLDALITAGGLSDRANDHKIILTRPMSAGQPRVILPVCYQQILQLGDTSTNYQLQPGDRIYVPSLTLWEDIKQSTQWRREKSCPQCRDYSLR